jgi:hypothetical protein
LAITATTPLRSSHVHITFLHIWSVDFSVEIEALTATFALSFFSLPGVFALPLLGFFDLSQPLSTFSVSVDLFLLFFLLFAPHTLTFLPFFSFSLLAGTPCFV